jgi:hypothetical protein
MKQSLDSRTVVAAALAAATVPTVFCCFGYGVGLLAIACAAFSLATVGRESALNRNVAFGAIVVSMLAMGGHAALMAVTSAVDSSQQAERVSAEADAKRKEAEAGAAAQETLRSSASALAANAMVTLTALDEQIAADRISEAGAALSSLKATLAPTLALQPVPEAVAPLSSAIAEREAYIQAWNDVAVADTSAKSGSMVAADEAYARAQAAVGGLSEAFRQAARPTLEASDITSRRSKISKKVVAEQRRMAKEKAEAERAAQESAALKAVCGDGPRVSGWDGSIVAVERYMKDRANDPGSIEVSSCTVPALTKACWRSRCQVRGKNGFGALVLNAYTFYIGRHPEYESMDAVLAMEE